MCKCVARRRACCVVRAISSLSANGASASTQHVPSADGTLSWEEVECIGVCANAPVVQIGSDTFEDLTPKQLEVVLNGFVSGKPPKPGSQIGRNASCPEDRSDDID